MPARLDWTDVLPPHPKAPSVHRPCEPVTLPRSVALDRQPAAGNLYQPVAVPAMPVKTQSVLPSASLSQVQSDKARAVKSSFQLGAMMM